MAIATNLGFPRIGPKRELKKAVEGFWAGRVGEGEMLETARRLRREAWTQQKEAGLQHVPSNDFSLYDQVLDAVALCGAAPSRYGLGDGDVDLRTYFAMARGLQELGPDGSRKVDLPAMEMTKWFDTNYHYIVPEIEERMQFRIASQKPFAEFEEASALGVQTRPVLIGPVSLLLLGKKVPPVVNRQPSLEALLPVYEEILGRLQAAGAEWVQMDEPCLVLDLPDDARATFQHAYERLAAAAPQLRLLVATYFGDLRNNLETALQLPVAGLHLDLMRGPAQFERALAEAPESLALSLGVVDGRNVWRTDLNATLDALEQAAGRIGSERMLVAPSCSLLHVPYDLGPEKELDDELRSWLAFAGDKLDEVALLTRALNEGRDAVAGELEENARILQGRRESPRTHNDAVRSRMAAVTEEMKRRKSPYTERKPLQDARLKLPAYPTTTIGSYPQTREVRRARADFKAGRSTREEYDRFLERETERTLRFQEDVGLDMLVHGEFERTDMVEYFGLKMKGFVATKNGWVQSYGTRCVRPPVLYGDVHRPEPMTVRWSRYAQSKTDRPVKGMLTGPVTILQWSFVRDDQPRADTCRQIALALRDEVTDLESAGLQAIQIDEPALREGLPLVRDDWKAYLEWAVAAFRLTACGVQDQTQIHTHMCYSEFNDIIEAVGAMDADVISIEASRSKMELLEAFRRYRYPNSIGPGVYDIHSPRVPSEAEMVDLLKLARDVIPADKLWVNPDCGLKTRGWPEVEAALRAMVSAAHQLRE